jgi:CMP-N,N'-diacetyllegionaminic acid synthase
MKIICIIPARGGSKGLIKKNVRILAGSPLISWPVKAALNSGVIDDIFVSTDDEEIAKCAREAGADVPFLRPKDLAQDDTTTEATLSQALKAYEQYKGIKYDIAVFLTATDVFHHSEWIYDAVNTLKNHPDIESVFSASSTHKNYWEEQVDGSWERILPWMNQYSNRQVRRKIYREDTGLVCASHAKLWRQGKRIGDKVKIILNDLSETAIDIHTEFDLFLAEQAIAYLKQNHPERVKLFL